MLVFPSGLSFSLTLYSSQVVVYLLQCRRSSDPYLRHTCPALLNHFMSQITLLAHVLRLYLLSLILVSLLRRLVSWRESFFRHLWIDVSSCFLWLAMWFLPLKVKMLRYLLCFPPDSPSLIFAEIDVSLCEFSFLSILNFTKVAH